MSATAGMLCSVCRTNRRTFTTHQLHPSAQDKEKANVVRVVGVDDEDGPEAPGDADVGAVAHQHHRRLHEHDEEHHHLQPRFLLLDPWKG